MIPTTALFTSGHRGTLDADGWAERVMVLRRRPEQVNAFGEICRQHHACGEHALGVGGDVAESDIPIVTRQHERHIVVV